MELTPHQKGFAVVVATTAMAGAVLAIVGNGGLGRIRHDNVAVEVGITVFMISWLTLFAQFAFALTQRRPKK